MSEGSGTTPGSTFSVKTLWLSPQGIAEKYKPPGVVPDLSLTIRSMSEAVPTPDPQGPQRKPPKEAIAEAKVKAPTRGNRKLESFLDAVNSDDQVRAWWYMTQVHAERLGMSDHSWVHMQIVLNIALRLLRLLVKAGVEPAVVADHGMKPRDAEVVVAGGALLHDVGMSIHRSDHEAYSLFLANEALGRLLADCYGEPERTVIASEILHS